MWCEYHLCFPARCLYNLRVLVLILETPHAILSIYLMLPPQLFHMMVQTDVENLMLMIELESDAMSSVLLTELE